MTEPRRPADPNKLAPAFGAPYVRSGQWAGRGQYLSVTIVTGGTAVSVPHGLGRVPQMLQMLDAGDNAFPAFTWPRASRTKTAISFNAPTAGTYLIWLA